MKFGPYWLDARLAVGGTAEVYVARPIDASASGPRKLIVKRLLPHFVTDPEGRTMFEREAALHAAVKHENVVEVYTSGVEGDEPWLAMELVDGCDLYRLLRRLTGHGRKLPASVAAYVARQVLEGLASVHGARDPGGTPMGIVHRDVTPSNIYLATDGRVKLGDFGIARSASRATMRSAGSAMLKGKFAYLAPEQVAGESFDHRADLFAMAVVLSEMLLGKPLFAGSGQLAVLLAIRDCRIDPLREVRGTLPKGLFEVLERALTRDPAQRFQTASALSEALAPFDRSPAISKNELSALVRWAQSAPSTDQMAAAVRDSSGKLKAAAVSPSQPQQPAASPQEPDSERITGEYAPIPSHVVTQGGEKYGPWPFARLVEAIATGGVGRGDMVDYMGRGMAPIEAIEELARFLPPLTATTNRLGSVGAPDFVDDVSAGALVSVLLRVVSSELTGVLFAEGPTESRRSPRGELLSQPEAGRKELYFVSGKLHHVSSNNASELLGEYMVRRGMISRDELDFALAVLPRYGGRMGDTLIALGLVASLDIFRAIRDQGRDRLVDLFTWPTGKLTFYSEQSAPHVEFPLELDLLPLVIAGMEAALPGDLALESWRNRLDATVAPYTGSLTSTKLASVTWPALAKRVLDAADGPKPVRDVLATVTQGGVATASEVLRVIEVLASARLLTVR
ncbi:MAG TPA: serine/threonine-protein kinase [Polyangiaceae bacterium]